MTSQDIGYYFYPSKYSPPLGHPKLDVYLMSMQSHRFFDAHKAIFPVAEPDGFRELIITHPWEDWMGPEVEKVCAGRFQLIDGNGVIHYGFSLGGDLRIQTQKACTICTLSSTAPIFNLPGDDPQSVEELLVDKIEVLFAQRMASWGVDEAGFSKRMSGVEPFALFIACLSTIEREIQEMPIEVKEHGYQTILRILKEATYTIKQAGEWPSDTPSISDLI